MDAKLFTIAALCIAAVLIAGCTGSPAGTPAPSIPTTTTGATITPVDTRSCTTDADCVPATCCHPTGCCNKAYAPACGNVACTLSCEGPIDCGAGSCGCVGGKCSVVPSAGR